MERFRLFVNHIVDLNEDQWLILADCLGDFVLKRGQFLLREGQVCRNIYFIEKGFCKSCYNMDGKEINTAFFFENDFATNIQSLTNQNASAYSIEACEPLHVVRIEKTKMLEAYKKVHSLETLGRRILESINSQQENHLNDFKLLTPLQRYHKLLDTNPSFFQRVSLSQAASFLGVSRETLSRLRARK